MRVGGDGGVERAGWVREEGMEEGEEEKRGGGWKRGMADGGRKVDIESMKAGKMLAGKVGGDSSGEAMKILN